MGGGGGSDDNAGGAGGSNIGSGGDGGVGWSCSAAPSGGLGGQDMSAFVSSVRLFMGGGGGGGQQNNGVGGMGGNGGGIIIISAKKITTSCVGSVKISANGAKGQSSGGDGSGGAGAGGTIYISSDIFNVNASCPLTVTSSGGNGGDVGYPAPHGGGGGGAQGSVIYSGPIPTSNVSSATVPGSGGKNTATGGNYAGSASGLPNAGILPNGGLIVLSLQGFHLAGYASSGMVSLHWTDENHQTLKSTVIERSFDAMSFNQIGSADIAYPSAVSISGDFVDHDPFAGKNWYRIRQTDISGKCYYSNIAEVETTENPSKLLVWPNPTAGLFKVRSSNPFNGSCFVSISEISGRVVQSAIFSGFQNELEIELDRTLPKGVYLLRIVSGSQSWIGKVWLQ